MLSLTPSVSRSRRYPVSDGQPVEEARLRIMRILFSDDVPEPRDIAIIALANACGVFRTILTSEERAQVRDRIDLLKNLDLIGRTMSLAIEGIEAPDEPASQAPAAEGDPGGAGPAAAGQRPGHAQGTGGLPCPPVPRTGPDLPDPRSGAPVRLHRGAGGGQLPHLAREDRLPVARAHGGIPQPDGLVAFDPDHGRDRSRHDAEGPGPGIRGPGHAGPRAGGRRHHPRRDRRVAGRGAVRGAAGVPEPHRRADGPHDGGLFAGGVHARSVHAAGRTAPQRRDGSAHHEAPAIPPRT